MGGFLLVLVVAAYLGYIYYYKPRNQTQPQIIPTLELKLKEEEGNVHQENDEMQLNVTWDLRALKSDFILKKRNKSNDIFPQKQNWCFFESMVINIPVLLTFQHITTITIYEPITDL